MPNMQDEREFKRQMMIEEREDKKRPALDNIKSNLILVLANQSKTASEIKEFWSMLKED